MQQNVDGGVRDHQKISTRSSETELLESTDEEETGRRQLKEEMAKDEVAGSGEDTIPTGDIDLERVDEAEEMEEDTNEKEEQLDETWMYMDEPWYCEEESGAEGDDEDDEDDNDAERQETMTSERDEERIVGGEVSGQGNIDTVNGRIERDLGHFLWMDRRHNIWSQIKATKAEIKELESSIQKEIRKRQEGPNPLRTN